MSDVLEVRVPDIGDFADVDVVEVAVAPGAQVRAEDTLISLESDKATLDVPSPRDGTVKDVKVSVGDKVSEGTLIVTLETADSEAPEAPQAEPPPPPAEQPQAEQTRTETPAVEAPAVAITGDADVHAEVVVLGSGPGGYTAAFRAADLGKQTVLIERYPNLGGVCLNVGCIPSKALLHTAEIMNAASEMAEHGVRFSKPVVEIEKLAAWKSSVVGRLTKGLAGLAKQRKVQTLHGTGRFEGPNILAVEGPNGTQRVSFEQAIIAAGSQAVELPGFPNDDERIMDSTDALALGAIPKRMLVIGGGIIGLEMATVYHALGTKVTVVELLPELIVGCDRDLVRPLQKRIASQYENIYLNTKVTAVVAQKRGLKVSFEGAKAPATDTFDRILVAVGRRPNGKKIDADKAGVTVNDAGFISVDSQQRTNVPHIFAIGDIVGQPMLAHKATHEGKVAAEVAAGLKSSFDALTIPSVAYTDPEVAWMGMTETEAKEKGIKYEKASFPWAASGRALCMGRDEGLTKLLFDKDSHRVIGAGVVGPHAGDLISEAVLGMEMGSDAQDIGLTVHPHPTLSETLCFAAEMYEGTITDLYVPRK